MKKLILFAIIAIFAISASVFYEQNDKAIAGVDNSATSLLNDYYNGGDYTKYSEIYYVGPDGDEYKPSYFHAGVDDLVRTTEYTSGKLYMYNSDGVNSGYKDVEGAMAHYYKNGDDEVIDYTVNGTTVEDFYYTLFDLKDTTGWVQSGTEYSLALTEQTSTPWVHFIAPLWISNHISITHVTMCEQNELLLKLYGKIKGVVETETLFASATITKAGVIKEEFTAAQLSDGFTLQGLYLPNNTITVGDQPNQGYILLKTNNGDFLTFNVTAGTEIRIRCTALSSDAELSINCQLEPEFILAHHINTIVLKVESDTTITISPTNASVYILAIEFSKA